MLDDIPWCGRSTRRGLLIGALGASVAGPGWAQSAAAPTATPHRGGTLNVAIPSDVKSLDPVFQVQFSERQPLYLLYNTLVGLAPDLSIIPELTERWETKDNTLVMHLRSGVHFHDGTVFDATAAKWNLDYRLDPTTNSPSKQLLGAAIASVDAPDAGTLVIHLKGPAPTLLGLLAQREGFMVSPAAAKKYGPNLGTNPVGSGPFVFKEWTQGSRLVLDRNPNYWDPGKPFLDRVVFLETADPVVGVQRLMTKEVDFIQALSPTIVRPLERVKDIRLDRNPGARWVSLEMRVDRAPYNNFKVRQAMAYALDRTRLANILMAGKTVVAEGPTPPSFWWFDPNLKSYPYDPTKAKALLAEAGSGDLHLRLSCQPTAEDQQIGQLVQEAFAAVGITVQVAPVSDWYSELLRGAISFLPIRWSQRPDPDGLLTYLFDSKSPANTAHYSNPELDALLDQARQLNDQAARRQLYWKAQEIITHDLPYIPLFFSVEYAALRQVVQNFVWIPDGIPRFREVWKSA